MKTGHWPKNGTVGTIPGRVRDMSRTSATKTVRYHGMMYKVVAQLLLLYNSDNWVVMGAMLKVLEGLHHRLTRHITGMMETRGAVGVSEYPSVMVSLEAAGLNHIMEYIRRLQAAITEKVACRPNYELCVEAEQRLGTRRSMIWWGQDVINEPEE